MNWQYNTTHSNATMSIPQKIMEIVQNKGVIAGISLFFVIIFLIFLIRRIIVIRNSKSLLKKRFTKFLEVQFEDDYEDTKPPKYGHLHFSIDYSCERSCLIVNVLELSELNNSSDNEADSYVKVRIEPDIWDMKPRKTKIVYKNNNPTFNKKFHFKTIPVLDLKKVIVVFEIYDHDVASQSDNMLGLVNFRVSSLTQTDMQEFPIEKKIEIEQPIDLEDGFGEICIILRHLPLEHLLKVTILEAKRLHIKRKKTYPPVFVSLTMYHKDEVIKTQKTAIIYNTREPFFSETFSFHLKPVKAPYTYLVIKVIQKLVLGLQKCIGTLKIGSESKTLSAKNHWTAMTSNPRVAMAYWHPLSKDK